MGAFCTEGWGSPQLLLDDTGGARLLLIRGKQHLESGDCDNPVVH